MTLTETAVFTKKAMVFGVLFLILLLLTWGIYSYYMTYIYKPPVVEEKPTLKFGKLPPPNLPTTKATSTLTYSLDTETGDLPTKLPKLVKIYSIAQLATDLLALDRAKSLSTSLGFGKNPEKLTVTEFRFIADDGGSLTINLDTGNFRFNRPISTDSANLSESRENFLNSNALSLQFTNYLGQKNLLKNQLKDGRTKVNYNSTRTIAEVTLWQKDIDEYPIVTDTFKEGLIKASVINLRDETKRYISLDYTFWPIDTDNFATYPIKTVKDAFTQLENGEGSVVLEPKTGTISITKVYLAYLLTKEYAPYLHPVFVFEGNEFAAYVGAVIDEYLEK